MTVTLLALSEAVTDSKLRMVALKFQQMLIDTFDSLISNLVVKPYKIVEEPSFIIDRLKVGSGLKLLFDVRDVKLSFTFYFVSSLDGSNVRCFAMCRMPKGATWIITDAPTSTADRDHLIDFLISVTYAICVTATNGGSMGTPDTMAVSSLLAKDKLLMTSAGGEHRFFKVRSKTHVRHLSKGKKYIIKHAAPRPHPVANMNREKIITCVKVLKIETSGHREFDTVGELLKAASVENTLSISTNSVWTGLEITVSDAADNKVNVLKLGGFEMFYGATPVEFYNCDEVYR